MSTYAEAVNKHYGPTDISARIIERLQQAGRDIGNLSREDLAPFDEFHGGGRESTRELARFEAGDRIVTRNLHPAGHTRLPRYARGRRGVIHRDHGVFIFADTHAMSRDQKPQHCYSVRFSSRELWGPQAAARDSVFVDLWDDHLDPA